VEATYQSHQLCGGDRLERAVMFGSLLQQIGESGNVHRYTRPGSRSVISLEHPAVAIWIGEECKAEV
jgi:hypothetical protein